MGTANRVIPLLLLFGCGVAGVPAVSVRTGTVGDRARRVEGTELRLERWEHLGPATPRTGFALVRSEDDWRLLWPDPRPSAYPPMRANFSQSMVAVGAPAGDDVLSIHVTHAVRTDRTVHIYAEQTVVGQGCQVEARASTPYDVVVLNRVDADVEFHVDTERAPTCVAPPTARVTCQTRGMTAPPTEKLSATMGQTIDCATSRTIEEGKSRIVDRTWTFAETPAGSFSKLTFLPGGYGGFFAVDLFGTYKVRLELHDDQGRTTAGFATVDVVAPPASLAAQLVWSKFDPRDDPSTFPRVEIHIVELDGDAKPMPPRPKGARPTGPGELPWGDPKSDCTTGTKAHFCDLRPIAHSTFVSLFHEPTSRYRIAVKYNDDRGPSGPAACVRIYKNGKKSADACDPLPRKADTFWDVGTLDAASGALEFAKTP